MKKHKPLSTKLPLLAHKQFENQVHPRAFDASAYASYANAYASAYASYASAYASASYASAYASYASASYASAYASAYAYAAYASYANAYASAYASAYACSIIFRLHDQMTTDINIDTQQSSNLLK